MQTNDKLNKCSFRLCQWMRNFTKVRLNFTIESILTIELRSARVLNSITLDQ